MPHKRPQKYFAGEMQSFLRLAAWKLENSVIMRLKASSKIILYSFSSQSTLLLT